MNTLKNVIINSPLQSVVIETEPNDASTKEVVSEPEEFEIPSKAVSEIKVEPINIK